jgi:hypothetical protein
MGHDSGRKAPTLQGILKTEIKMAAKDVCEDDGKYTFTLRFDEAGYNLVRSMLDTGAPVWFGLQKSREGSD